MTSIDSHCETEERTSGTVRIDMSPECSETLARLYQMVSDGDTSTEALEVTKVVIDMNSSSYTAWYWRRKCLLVPPGGYESLTSLLMDECDFVDDWCCRNPKNYQIWFHRRWLVTELHSRQLTDDLLSSELESIDVLIELEPKHYNAWSHRLFLLTLFPHIVRSELEFSSKFISLDVRNNSAWSYRREVVSRLVPTDPSLPSSEIEFTLSQLRLAPSNESPWVYLRSFDFLGSADVFEFCEECVGEGMSNRHAVDTYVAILQHQLRDADCLAILSKLAKEDHMRANIIQRRIRRLTRS
jgi:protein farnesyltransferase/geranylgeranyltransferase type-1 subunit alpha